MEPVCLKKSVLRPFETFKELVPQVVKIETSDLQTRLASMHSTLERIVEKESDLESAIPDGIYISNEYHEGSYFKVVYVKELGNVYDLCTNKMGDLVPFDELSPQNLFSLYKELGITSTLVWGFREKDIIFSAANYPIAKKAASSDEWGVVVQISPKDDDPEMESTKYKTELPNDAGAGVSGYPAICQFHGRRPGAELTSVILDVVSEMKDINEKILTLSNDLSLLLENAPQKRHVPFGPKYELPLGGFSDLEDMISAFDTPGRTADHQDILQLKLLVGELRDLLDSFMVVGDDMMFRESPDHIWKWFHTVGRQGLILTAEVRATDTQVVSVYTIDSLYVGSEYPYRMIDQRFFITRGGQNFTSNVAPSKEICKMGVCSIVKYGELDAVCASSMIYGGQSCPLKTSIARKLVQEESCEDRFAYVISPEPSAVMVKCRSDTSKRIVNIDAGNWAVPETCVAEISTNEEEFMTSVAGASFDSMGFPIKGFFSEWNATNVMALTLTSVLIVTSGIIITLIRNRFCPTLKLNIRLPFRLRREREFEEVSKEDVVLRGDVRLNGRGHGGSSLFLSSAPRRALAY